MHWIDWLGWRHWHWAEVWAGVGAVATALAALVAIVTLLALKKDSRDRTRPVVVATLRHAILTADSELHIENLGQSVARNLRVTFSPPIPTACEGKTQAECEHIAHDIALRYAKPIAVLAPGVLLDNVYLPGKLDKRHLEPLLAEEFVVNVHYEDDRKRSYRDEFPLAMDVLGHQSGAYPSTSGEAGERRRLVKAVEHIARGIGRA